MGAMDHFRPSYHINLLAASIVLLSLIESNVMSNAVHWTLEVSVNEGQLSAFKNWWTEMVLSTRGVPATLTHEWFFDEDESTSLINERYHESAAALTHLQGFWSFAERFMPAVTPIRFNVLGNLSAELRDGLAGLNPRYLKLEAGFSR